MKYGQYASRSRYRDRNFKRTVTFFLFVFVFAGSIVLGFVFGKQFAVTQISTLEKEVADKDANLKTLQDEMTKLRAETQTASSRFDQLKMQYEKDFPQEGAMHEIVDMVRKQISDGMPAERLAFLIRSARPPRNCSDPVTKRFVVKTPAYKGADSAVSIGDGAVVITASGASSHSRDGGLESWFDPTQLIKVVFKTAEGEVENKSATLPLQHTVVSKGREYRFNLAAGETSFVKVTFDSCDYP